MVINKNWEDDFYEGDYDDYKSAHVERERLRQENSTVGWIYIGLDTRNRREAKVGLTSGALGTRASSTQNPHYALLCAFKVKDGVDSSIIKEIESAVHGMLEQRYARLKRVGTGRKTEWFVVNPFNVRQLVHDFLYENYNKFMHCYHCHERDMGIIYSWKNDQLINGGSRIPYQAADLSNPPIAFECSMPPGCGADCDCW